MDDWIEWPAMDCVQNMTMNQLIDRRDSSDILWNSLCIHMIRQHLFQGNHGRGRCRVIHFSPSNHTYGFRLTLRGSRFVPPFMTLKFIVHYDYFENANNSHGRRLQETIPFHDLVQFKATRNRVEWIRGNLVDSIYGGHHTGKRDKSGPYSSWRLNAVSVSWQNIIVSDIYRIS